MNEYPNLSTRRARLWALVWMAAFLADYFLQFFGSRFWRDLALPLLGRMGLK